MTQHTSFTVLLNVSHTVPGGGLINRFIVAGNMSGVQSPGYSRIFVYKFLLKILNFNDTLIIKKNKSQLNMSLLFSH